MSAKRRFPSALVTVIAEALAGHHTHAELDGVFSRAGAPGDPPQDSKLGKCKAWLWKVSEAPRSVEILGRILEELMDADYSQDDPRFPRWDGSRQRLLQILGANGFTYRREGRLSWRSMGPATERLATLVREQGLSAIEDEIERAVSAVDTDPATATTGACAALEALCKHYVDSHGLPMPSDQSLLPLWNRVRDHLGLDPKVLEEEDLRMILRALPQLVQGIARLRTHAGSAHGRGTKRYRLEPRHARLAVNAAHTLATFLIETIAARERAGAATVPPRGEQGGDGP